MKRAFLKRVLPNLLAVFVLALLTVYILLDAFIIARRVDQTPITRDPSSTFFPITTKKPTPPDTPDTEPSATEPGSTTDDPSVTSATPPVTTEPEPPVNYPILEDLYYKDENIEISIEETYRENQHGVFNRVFVVDLKLSDIEYLRTAFAEDQYGYKIRETTSTIAQRYNAVFAINGDYYGYRKDGFVLRNYDLYRDTPRKESDDDALVLFNDGSLFVIDENKIPATSLPMSVYQCFSFGPRLVENGKIAVNENSEVDFSQASNPRTAIGMVEPLHYKIVVSEGRLYKNDGLTLMELAELMEELGCETAYNLDGGSSTTLYFNGQVLNELPGDERKVSDIIFINGKSFSEDPN